MRITGIISQGAPGSRSYMVCVDNPYRIKTMAHSFVET
jgi:hypothetical protein